MSACYKQVELQNLDIIRKKTLELFPNNDWYHTHLFYIDNNVDRFYEISELTEELKRLDFYGHIYGFALLIVKPNQEIPIHCDTGPFTYSFNIPIMGCSNTEVIWYKSNANPVERRTAQNSIYMVYEPEHCEVIDRYDMNTPAIINVKTPHKVVNHNSREALPRITLLVRVTKDIEL